MNLLYELYKLATAVSHPSDYHGVEHWTRVERNASYLCSLIPDADPMVVRAFALVHDCRRVKDGHDPEHGPRAALSIDGWANAYGSRWTLNHRQTALLKDACRLHTAAAVDDGDYDITLQACFDADRLDLGRMDIAPDPCQLFTDPARDIALQGRYRFLDENYFSVTAAHHLVPIPLVEEYHRAPELV